MASSLYIALLKKMLVDYDAIETSEWHPLFIVEPNYKTFWLFPLDRLLRKRNFSIGKLISVTEELRVEGLDWPARAKTMIGLKRLDNIELCIESILNDNIPGDFIETGVWRGGAGMLMRAILLEKNIVDRKIWLADSFQGLPKPDEKNYAADNNNPLYKYKILKASLEEVIQNFKKFDLPLDQVEFVQGWFKDTLPHCKVEQLSLLRLDGDLYESTILALDHLYHKLSQGGFVIVDDYNAFPNCRKAVDDFRTRFGINQELITIDREAVYWRK